jgi:4-diphosphocytidyl-2-C-methyl-D-erythritol kinase
MTSAQAFAKVNLGLVVGPLRSDGKHEVATVLVAVDLHDSVDVTPVPKPGVVVDGFDDAIIRRALTSFAGLRAGTGGWRVTLEKRIPVAAGLGGGSSDAAAALRIVNGLAPSPLPAAELRRLAAEIGSDVPFFLEDGPRFATGDGTDLKPVVLPLGFRVLIVLPHDEAKASTASVYERFDERGGAAGYEERKAALAGALGRVRTVGDLAALPGNDLASSPLSSELLRLGALRADVTGAGPAVYGLFVDGAAAEAAELAMRDVGMTWLVDPVGR